MTRGRKKWYILKAGEHIGHTGCIVLQLDFKKAALTSQPIIHRFLICYVSYLALYNNLEATGCDNL